MRKEFLIKKLVQKSISEAEVNELLILISADSTPPSDELMEQIWAAHTSPRKDENAAKERTWTRLESELGLEDEPSKRAVWLRALPRIAAAVVLLIIAGFALLHNYTGEELVQTSSDQRAIALEDGSSMLLNANSIATYSSPRRVSLQGEAYFDVEKKPSEEIFEVETKHALVEVLGTKFNVKSTKQYTSVYLEEGSVRLYFPDLDSTVLMEPGNLVLYQQETQALTLRKGETAQTHLGWREGVELLEDLKLKLVLAQMERLYDVQFEVKEESALDRIVTFPLPTSSLETAISLLESTLVDLQITQHHPRYIIQPK